MSYDFVIVGGGSAGSVLANRLSADPSNRVLVLEAGRPDYPWDVFIHMPAALTFPIGSRFYDWKYESEPEPHMNGRRIHHARGKVLGGSSSINGMIFQRGNPLDYERWGADPGMRTWDFSHCLPYFKRMESCLAAAEDDAFRGHAGPLVLERGPAKGPLFDAFFEAVQQAGYPLTDDVNGYRQEGFAAFEDEGPRVPSELVALGRGEAVLHPLEVRETVRVVPRLHAGVGSPALVVQRVAALEDHPVDGARPAEHLAARVVDAPAVHVRLRLGLVLPVVEAAADRERQRGGHLDEDIPDRVVAPRLEHQHPVRRVLRQPVGERAAGGATADDHEVVRAHSCTRRAAAATNRPTSSASAVPGKR